MMQLKVTHVSGQIGIKTQKPILSIRQPKADLQIETTEAKLNIKTNHLKIKIDQRQCFSEVGLKSVFELTRDYAQMGKEAALKAMARISNEGDRMARIEDKVNVIAQIANEKTFPMPDEFNIKLIPQSRPKIQVEGGVSFIPEAGMVEIKAKINQPEIDVVPGSVKVYMRQQPYLGFEFVDNIVDMLI